MPEHIRKKLQEEIEVLEHELQHELPKELKKAVAMGDLSENAEYHMAKQRQEFVRARLGQLKKRMGDLSLINLSNIPKDKAGLGSRVKVYDMSKEEEIDRREEHLNYFVNQLFHIVLVTEAARLDNIDPWEHICIGSDFDGFIRTIDCCKDASELSNFADELMKQLPKLAKDSGLRLRKSPQELIENIFFNNCFNIISKYAR